MDSLRAGEKAVCELTESELEKACAGIQLALKTSKDFYARAATHGASDSAGGGVISLWKLERLISPRT